MTNNLSDRDVVLVLQELAEDLSKASQITSPEEARLAITSLAAAAGQEGAIRLPESDLEAVAAGRRLLAHAALDEDAATIVQTLTDDPPADDQLAVETALATVVVIAAVIAFLQTKISFKVHRDEKGTRVDFEVLKKSTSDPILHKAIDILVDVFRAP
jgi:hypothetical protein